MKKIHEMIDAACNRGVDCLRKSLGYDNTLTEDELQLFREMFAFL